MTVRNIKKNLIGMEDLLQGLGTLEQSRANSIYTMGRIDVPYAVATVEAMQALDVTVFTRARVYSDDVTYTDYIYDDDATEGITPDTGSGYWVEATSLMPYMPAGTGAVATDVQSTLNQRALSLDRFLSAGQISDIRNGTLTGDLDTEFQRFLDELAGYSEGVIPYGTIPLGDATLSLAASNCTLRGRAKFQKVGTNIVPMFQLADEVSDVDFVGLTFDGNKAGFSSGNAVPVIFGYLNQRINVERCRFLNVIDVGVKLRDAFGLTVDRCYFYNIGQNGVETHTYDVDPRTNLSYTGTRPELHGGHTVKGSLFHRIDDGNSGAGDGCAYIFAANQLAAGTPNTITDVSFNGNRVLDCLRGFWTENNISGYEAMNIAATGNAFHGNIAGSGTVETKDGIGLVGVRGATIGDNTFYNIGNFTPVGGECACVQLSSAVDVEVSDNQMLDDTGVGVRTDVGVNVASGCERVDVFGNRISGMSDSPITVSTSAIDINVSGNPGGTDAQSWNHISTVPFYISNVAASSSNVPLYPYNVTADSEWAVPTNCKLVGVQAKWTAAQSAGALTIETLVNAVVVSTFDIDEADFSGGLTIASKLVNTDNAAQVDAGQRITCRITTDGSFLPASSNDLAVTIYLDLAGKE